MISKLVDALIAAGCTADQIGALVKAYDAHTAESYAAEEARVEAKRASDRERQARHRLSRNVTVTPRDTALVTDEVSPKEIPPAPPKEITPSSRSGSERVETFPSTAPSQASGASLRLVEDEPPEEIPAILDRRAYPRWFEELWAEYRPIASPNATKADAHRAAARLSEADRKNLWLGLVRYAVWLAEERKKRADTPAKHLATFINRRGWEPFLETEDADRVAG